MSDLKEQAARRVENLLTEFPALRGRLFVMDALSDKSLQAQVGAVVTPLVEAMTNGGHKTDRAMLAVRSAVKVLDINEPCFYPFTDPQERVVAGLFFVGNGQHNATSQLNGESIAWASSLAPAVQLPPEHYAVYAHAHESFHAVKGLSPSTFGPFSSEAVEESAADVYAAATLVRTFGRAAVPSLKKLITVRNLEAVHHRYTDHWTTPALAGLMTEVIEPHRRTALLAEGATGMQAAHDLAARYTPDNAAQKEMTTALRSLSLTKTPTALRALREVGALPQQFRSAPVWHLASAYVDALTALKPDMDQDIATRVKNRLNNDDLPRTPAISVMLAAWRLDKALMLNDFSKHRAPAYRTPRMP